MVQKGTVIYSLQEKKSNKNIFGLLTELGQKVIDPTCSRDKILPNKKSIPQGSLDNINYGVFCLEFIEKRITRSFDSIENDITTDPIQLRCQFTEKLVENIRSNLV